MPPGLPRDLAQTSDQLKILWFIDDPALEYNDSHGA